MFVQLVDQLIYFEKNKFKHSDIRPLTISVTETHDFRLTDM